MARWDGFSTFGRDEGGPRQLRVHADYGGSDENPIPLALITQRRIGTRSLYDTVELTEEELRWLVDKVAPVVLHRMGQRP